MNTLPFAQPADLFSDGLIYRFRLRPLTPAATNGTGRRSTRAATSSSSTASSPIRRAEGGQPPEQEGTCTLSTGGSVSFRVGDPEGGSGPGIRAFAGVRWDPFIMDAPAALKTIATRKLSFTDPGAIYLDGKNVLSLVVEIDTVSWGAQSLVGVVAETLTRGRFNVRIERVGRPEVKNMMLAPEGVRHRQPGPGDPRPVQHGGRVPPRGQLPGCLPGPAERQPRVLGRPRRNGGLAPDENGDHPLTDLVLADFLVVDVTKPYVEQGSYLEIELAARRGEAHQTCGGRTLNDDVIDTLFTQLVNAGNGPVIRDGVDHASRPAGRTFPYLAAPNPDPPKLPEHH